MYLEASWRIILNTANREKAQKVFRNIKPILGDCAVQRLEIYWKDKSLHDLQLTNNILGKDTNACLCNALKVAFDISLHWNLYEFSPESKTLSGVSDSNIKIVGVKWLSLNIC